MAVTTNEAAQVMVQAGAATSAPDDERLPVRRVAICRRLLDYYRSHDPELEPIQWNTPLDELVVFSDFEPDEVLCLPYVEGWDNNLQTFGELVLRIEDRLRQLWQGELTAGCHSQAVFYELRRAIQAWGGALPHGPRLRPTTPLRDCLPAGEAEGAKAIMGFVKRRFGIDNLPVTHRVLGCGGLLGALVGILCGLSPVWDGVETLGDLTHWILRQNAESMRVLHSGQRFWA